MIDKNNPGYNGEMQEHIWNIATNIIPLEITLPMIPEELREPCIDLYNFMNALYNDMYENAAYYELNTIGDVGHKLGHFFGWLYKKFRFFDGELTVGKNEYKNFVKHCGEKNVEIMFSRNGFSFDGDGDNFRLINSRYPGMFRAFSELLESAYTNYKVNSTDYLISCDFRALVKYKRTYADILYMLNDEGIKIAEQLTNFAAGIGVNPDKCTFFSRVDFKKKGKRIFILNAVRQKNLQITIFAAEVGSEAFQMVGRKIEKYDDAEEFKEFWLKNRSGCGNCKTECWHKSNPKELFGKRVILCGGIPNVNIYAPKEEDITHICRLIELRTMIINAGLS